MAIINTEQDFNEYTYISNGIVNEFLHEAIEFDCDAIRDSVGNTFICGLTQHIEHAGIHSGDSSCSFPSRVSIDIQNKLQE